MKYNNIFFLQFINKIHPIVLIFILTGNLHLNAQTVQFYPHINTIGIQINLEGWDADKNGHCEVRYKRSQETIYRESFPLDRILLNNIDQYRGSLFLLKENTEYDIEILLEDSFPINVKKMLGPFKISSLNSPKKISTSSVKWVAPNGSGTAYTEANPGNIKTLLSSGTVSCGTTIYLKDGVYDEQGLALNLTKDCTENAPIQIVAAPGAQPVFDGGNYAKLNWKVHPGDPKRFYADLPIASEFTTLFILNDKALYPYPESSPLFQFGNYCLENLNFEYDGFVRTNAGIEFKTQSIVDPLKAQIILSKAFRFLTIYGNNKNAYLLIKGINVKNYGKPSINGTTAYSAIALDLRNLHNVVIDSCQFEYNTSHITFSGICNNLIIQNNTFKHQNGLWSHAMIKKSLISNFLFPRSMGRAMETGALEFHENKNVIVRNNQFDGVNSGYVGDFTGGLIEEVDIYDNIFTDNFDAIECDGNECNIRIWNNTIIRPMAGFSIAPPLIGPRYFYRNTIAYSKGRNNEIDDPYFSGCTPPIKYESAGIAIKTNSEPIAGEKSNLYFFNNTFYTEDSLGFSFSFWDSEWKQIHFVNNIFFDKYKHFGYFHDLGNKPYFQFNFENNNFYNSDPSIPIIVAKEEHGEYNCISIFASDSIEKKLQSIAKSNLIKVSNSSFFNPNFVNPILIDFSLNSKSSCIDIGNIIPGFYDYKGTKPDLGAIESDFSINNSDQLEPSAIIEIYPNPAQNLFIISAQTKDLIQLNIFSIDGSLLLSKNNIQAHSQIKTNLQPGIYIAKIETQNKKHIIKKLMIN